MNTSLLDEYYPSDRYYRLSALLGNIVINIGMNISRTGLLQDILD